jgi:HSP20 family protein
MNYLTRWQQPETAGWSGIGRLSSLRDEIDRLFEAPLAELARSTQWLSGWSPALDVYEEKDNFIVKAELPGMKKEDIEVALHEGNVTISGERKGKEQHKDADVYRSERFVGRFQRTFALPAPVAADKVKAQYRDGVLTITLPKTEEAKPKQIDVSVS